MESIVIVLSASSGQPGRTEVYPVWLSSQGCGVSWRLLKPFTLELRTSLLLAVKDPI